MQPSGISVSIRESLVAGASRTQTTLVVDPLITKDGHRVTMTDIGDIAYAKIGVGTSQEEIISFTGITDNTSTYTLTGVTWGYNFYNTTGDVDVNKKKHNSGESFIIGTDFHFVQEQFVNADSNQTIAGVKTFSSSPVVPTPTTDYQASTKKYADDLAIAGSPDASTTVKGISKLSSAPASATNPIAVGDNDPRLPTTDEKAAIAGNSGTAVSSSNKLVDADDVTNDGTASKIVRLDSNSQATIAETPTADAHAASKKYVDDNSKSYSSMLSFYIGNVSSSSTAYHAPFVFENSDATVTNREMLTSSAGTISNLHWKASSAGSAAYITVTLYKNGSATTLTTTGNQGDVSGSDTSNSVSFVAGDKISLEIKGVNDTTADVIASVEVNI